MREPSHDPWTRRHTGLHPPLLRESLVEMIGNTPLVRLNQVSAHLPKEVEIWVKLEFMNPGGSVKDRAARQIMLEAMASGELDGDKTLIDATSGNTGVAYAMLGAALGVSVTLVMPDDVPPQRRSLIEVYGARVIASPPELGLDGAFAHLQRHLLSSPAGAYYHAHQHGNPANPMAHAMTTAAEIATQTEERVTHFVCAIGSSGTLMGTARGLRARNPEVQVIGAYPSRPDHGIEGLRHLPSSVKPTIFDPSQVDAMIEVDAGASYTMARQLATREGILSGPSGGANVLAALSVASTLSRGVVVTIICDNQDRYAGLPGA